MSTPKENPFVVVEESRNKVFGNENVDFPGGFELCELRVSFGGRLVVTVGAAFQGEKLAFCKISSEHASLPVNPNTSPEDVEALLGILFAKREWNRVKLADVLVSGWQSLCQRK